MAGETTRKEAFIERARLAEEAEAKAVEKPKVVPKPSGPKK
jgi:hypothetical protein